MAPTLVATAGATTANSFATQAEGTTYCDARLNSSAWTSAATADKDRALIEATRELNVLTWAGLTVTTTQALAWPRQYVTNPDSPTGDYVDSTIVPQRLKDATTELALQFLIAGTTDLAALDATQGVIRKRVDVLETEWAKPYERAKGLARFPRVLDLIKPFLVTTGNSVPLVKG